MRGDKVNSRSPFSQYDGDAGGVCVSHRGAGKCEYGRGSLPTELGGGGGGREGGGGGGEKRKRNEEEEVEMKRRGGKLHPLFFLDERRNWILYSHSCFLSW